MQITPASSDLQWSEEHKQYFLLTFWVRRMNSVLYQIVLDLQLPCTEQHCHSSLIQQLVCYWPAHSLAAYQPSPCPALPAGMKAAPEGRSPLMTLCRKCEALAPPSFQDRAAIQLLRLMFVLQSCQWSVLTQSKLLPTRRAQSCLNFNRSTCPPHFSVINAGICANVCSVVLSSRKTHDLFLFLWFNLWKNAIDNIVWQL